MSMKTKKYLFYFGYIGSQFRGVQKTKNLRKNDKTIATCLETSLLSLSPLNTPLVYTASRTDSGVHAIRSAFHSELCLPPRRGVNAYQTEEEYITQKLNDFFTKSCLEIRIYKTQKVPHGFHARHRAVRRTYLYRIAEPCSEDVSVPRARGLKSLVVELNRCHLVKSKLDISAMQAACEILKGCHDFSYYTRPTDCWENQKSTVRTLDEVKIVPGSPVLDPIYDKHYENFRFWDIIVSSQSFLYRQVRKIVTVLLSVGVHLHPPSFVESTFFHPLPCWVNGIAVVKPGGLYLLSVEYPAKAFLEETYTKEEDNTRKELLKN